VINLDSGRAVEPDVGAATCFRVRCENGEVFLHRADARGTTAVAERETCAVA